MPMANLTLAMTVIALLWKSSIGLKWLPFGLGPAFDQITSQTPRPYTYSSPVEELISSRPAQYPRRGSSLTGVDGDVDVDGDERFWTMVYFCMYGLMGFFAQYGGRKLSQDQPLVRWSLLYGTFHLAMAGHHLCWAISGMWNDGGRTSTYGKLELWKFNLPGCYAVTAVTSMIMMAQAGRIILMALVSSSSSRGRRASKGRLAQMHLTKIRQIKTVLDFCSVWTLLAFVVFWMFNLIGFDAPMIVDRILWAVTFYPMPWLAAVGFLSISRMKVKKQVFQ